MKPISPVQSIFFMTSYLLLFSQEASKGAFLFSVEKGLSVQHSAFIFQIKAKPRDTKTKKL